MDLDERLSHSRNRSRPATPCIKHTECSRESAGRENTLVEVHVYVHLHVRGRDKNWFKLTLLRASPGESRLAGFIIAMSDAKPDARFLVPRKPFHTGY